MLSFSKVSGEFRAKEKPVRSISVSFPPFRTSRFHLFSPLCCAVRSLGYDVSQSTRAGPFRLAWFPPHLASLTTRCLPLPLPRRGKNGAWTPQQQPLLPRRPYRTNRGSLAYRFLNLPRLSLNSSRAVLHSLSHQTRSNSSRRRYRSFRRREESVRSCRRGWKRGENEKG